MENPNEFSGFSNSDFGVENALARIVRRRWPTNTLCYIMAEWGLTKGQAQGVLYATASRSTINVIIKHKRGGLRLLVTLGCLVTGETLEHFLKSEIEALENEASTARARAQSLAIAEKRLFSGALGSLGAECSPNVPDMAAGRSTRRSTEPAPMGSQSTQ